MISKKIKYLFIIGIFIIAGFALADSLGVFNSKPYTEVPLGAQTHYVPKNRDPAVGIDKFPITPPGPNQIITPQGQIVSKAEWEQQQKNTNQGDENAE